MEEDRTQIQETSRNHCPSSHHMESPGKRRRRSPWNTRQIDTEMETKEMGYTGRVMERMATDRKQWRSMVDGLCSQRANIHKYVSNWLLHSFMACCQLKFRASFDILPVFFPFVQTSVYTSATRDTFGKGMERKLAIREAFELFGRVLESVR